MKVVSKDFCTLTANYMAIYMGPCCRSYILLIRKFRTSEMLDKWSPTSKLSDIKLSHYPDCRYIFFTCTRTHLSALSLTCVLISSNLFPCLWLNFEYWITCKLGWFRCKSATAYVLHNLSQRSCRLVFLLTLLEFSLTEFLRGFSRCIFSLA